MARPSVSANGTAVEPRLLNVEEAAIYLGGVLRAYFDPASGAFTERVQRLLRADRRSLRFGCLTSPWGDALFRLRHEPAQGD